MRVTNQMLANSFLSDLNTNMQNLKTIQEQMASGKNFSRPSDDPFNVARAMQMHTAVNANTQYNKNITNTINWLDTTDTALGQLGNVFQRIREQLVSAGNAAYSSDERQSTKDEINQRVGQIAQILNTSFDGEYIFGGTRGNSKPVDAQTIYTLPSKIGKSNENGADVNVSGAYTGNTAASYSVRIKSVDANGKVLSAAYKSDNGIWTDVIPDGNNDINIGNGLTINIPANINNKGDSASSSTDGDTYNFSMNQDIKLIYRDDNGNVMAVEPVESDKITDVTTWSNKSIKFNVSSASNTTGTDITISLSDFNGKTIDDIVEDINSKIDSTESTPATTPATYPLKGKVIAEKTSDGRISFKASSDDVIKIVPDAGTGTPTDPYTMSVADLASCQNKQFSSIQFDMIQSKRQTEISQGVLAQYNTSASDVIKYGQGSNDDIRNLLEKIVNHLNGYIEQTDSQGNLIKDASGNVMYTQDQDKATQALTNQDLSDMDAVMSQFLKVRSDVGARQNRMDNAKTQNEQSNTDMTDILSKTEDVDITKKTMEYATAQTVYMASLQTSARVLQPTLMDYLR